MAWICIGLGWTGWIGLDWIELDLQHWFVEMRLLGQLEEDQGITGDYRALNVLKCPVMFSVRGFQRWLGVGAPCPACRAI